ncbi:MAG: methyltransferase domain-containing protein [Aestuariivirga sp.]
MTDEPQAIFDRALYVKRVKRARADEPNILARAIAGELAGRLALVTRVFECALIIAPDPRPIADVVKASGKVRHAVVRELPEDDDLGLALEDFDCVFNILDLHAVNDVPGQMSQMRRALKPDGLFLACLFGGETLSELRQSWLAAEVLVTGGASPRVAPMNSVRELGSLLQRTGFALPVADLDRTIVRYGDAISLVREVSRLGMSNNLVGRSRQAVSRRLFNAAMSHYREHFADADTRVRATLELVWLTGWSPHESQQQPLKPGSAKMRLADALHVPEAKLKRD